MTVMTEEKYLKGMERLVEVVLELSQARSVEAVMAVVRRAARELAGADGATLILKEEDRCFYADEDAIAPLWKGKRFPMKACVSGWVMLNKKPAVIPDIYSDPRVPGEAYRPTFVKSLACVPIRAESPIGAIGTYWAKSHEASPSEVRLLQALADSTAVALENAALYAELEARVGQRTAQLAAANEELAAFSSAASHDLQAPLRHMRGFSQLLLKSGLTGEQAEYARIIERSSEKMSVLVRDLLSFAKHVDGPLARQEVDLSAAALEVVAELAGLEPERGVDVDIAHGLRAWGDPTLLKAVVFNLLRNAWKFTAARQPAHIAFGRDKDEFFVRDDGEGFDPAHAAKLFAPFTRLHDAQRFPGTGIGLATVRRIIARHGGSVRAEGRPGAGATFYFTLPGRPA